MGLKTIIAAGFAAVTMLLLPVAQAEANTRIVVGIGAPLFGGFYGGGYYGGGYCYNHPYRCGVAPRRYPVYLAPRFNYYVAPPLPVYYNRYVAPVGRVSCGGALNIVDRSGFNNVRVGECRGDVYTFTAHRNGNRFVVKVNSFNGRIIGANRY